MGDSLDNEEFEFPLWLLIDSSSEWPSPLDHQPTTIIEF